MENRQPYKKHRVRPGRKWKKEIRVKCMRKRKDKRGNDSSSTGRNGEENSNDSCESTNGTYKTKKTRLFPFN